jgi:transposase
MTAATESFATWLARAPLGEEQLTPRQLGVLEAAFTFRQRCGCDYYSTRLLSHFLLHAGTGLPVAQIARLLGLSRPTASRQQRVSSKEAIQSAHHRLAGRPYGKLLARYAGAIAEFLCRHPDASRYDVLDFIQRTWDVRVSRVALYRFLKKYGLDRLAPAARATAAAQPPLPGETLTPTLAEAAVTPATTPSVVLASVPAGQPVPEPAPPFSWHTANMPAPSCSSRRL